MLTPGTAWSCLPSPGAGGDRHAPGGKGVFEYCRTHSSVRGRQKIMLCLDEVQLVKGWESFVRRILDTEKVEVFLNGSSAKMLSQEVSTSMRGRALEVIIHPV